MISDLAEIRLNFHLKREILILASEIASVPRHIENYIIPVEDLRGLDTSVQNQILQLQLELLRDIRRTVQPPESSPSSSRMHLDCNSALQMRPVHRLIVTVKVQNRKNFAAWGLLQTLRGRGRGV